MALASPIPRRQRRFGSALGLLVACLLSCTQNDDLAQAQALAETGSFSEAAAALQQSLARNPSQQEPLREALAAVHVRWLSALLEEAQSQLDHTKPSAAAKTLLEIRRLQLPLSAPRALSERYAALLSRCLQSGQQLHQQLTAQNQLLAAAELSARLRALQTHGNLPNALPQSALSQMSYFLRSEAKAAQAQGYFGSAALQWALAQAYSAPIARSQVAESWQRFLQQKCLRPPALVFNRPPWLEDSFYLDELARLAKDTLEHVLPSCPQGGVPLTLVVDIEDASFSAGSAVWDGQASASDPAQALETVNTLPYTQTQMGVREQSRTLLPADYGFLQNALQDPAKKKRWQQLRPVPLTDKQLSLSQRSAELTYRLPLNLPGQAPHSPTPGAKAVHFERNLVLYSSTLQGKISVREERDAPQPFAIHAQAADSGHSQVGFAPALLPADPIVLPSREELQLENTEVFLHLLSEVAKATQQRWLALYRAYLAQLPATEKQAQEDLYLTLLALGDTDINSAADSFFQERYGLSTASLLSTLSLALGWDPQALQPEGSPPLAALLPRRPPELLPPQKATGSLKGKSSSEQSGAGRSGERSSTGKKSP